MADLKRCLVTGGAGFIGSHIVDALLMAGHSVAVLDNLSSGKRHFVPSGVEFFEQSILSDLEPVFVRFKPQVVFHQAAHISVSVSTREPMMDAEQNILGSIHVLETCVRHGVERVVYASSGAYYGEPVYLPLDEDHPNDAVSPYGISKGTVERYLYYYRMTTGLESVALRYANVYGPRQDPHGEAGVIAIFSEKLLAGEIPVIFGDGEQTRDFVYVKDVAQANLAAMNAELVGDMPRIYNVSTGLQTSVNALYAVMKEAYDSPYSAHHAEKRSGDVYHAVLSNQRIQEHLHWKPQVDLRTGIFETADYFKRGGTEYR